VRSFVGLSEVSVEQIERAQQVLPIVSVQNRYNLTDRRWEDVVEEWERQGLAFLPYFPLATGELARPGGPLDRVAARHGAMPGQIAIAWLLHRSLVMLPIPGTSKVPIWRRTPPVRAWSSAPKISGSSAAE
jgi:pyridoxine 4-dehydrogenase